MRRQNSFNMGTNVPVLHPRLVVAAFTKLVVVVADNAFAVAPSMQLVHAVTNDSCLLGWLHTLGVAKTHTQRISL